jgi:hypothetical protein
VSTPARTCGQALFRKGQLKALVDVHSAQGGMGGYLTPDEVRAGTAVLRLKWARSHLQ